jgi:Protein of unknown function (DUF550)
MDDFYSDFFDFRKFECRRREWSADTFGPLGEGMTLNSVIDHLAEEVDEVKETPHAADEWADIIQLGLEGAFRAGLSVADIWAALWDKHFVNEERKWPDWRLCDPNKKMKAIKNGQ